MNETWGTTRARSETTYADARPCSELGVQARFRRLFFALVIFLFVSGVARAAPVVFDPANYTALVSSGASETIGPGTQINLGNWQHYKHYLPFGIQVLYSGQYLWHVGSTPDFTITVGPTIRYKWPRRYLEDTEKYGGQTRLVKANTGGYAISNYVAGLPFPIHSEPNVADKVIYNLRYGPSPSVLWREGSTFAIDRFLNVREWDWTYKDYRLSHVSTAGVAVNPPYGRGYLNSQRVDFTAPEDSRYFVELNMQPDDPSALSELFLYIPQLRRSYRNSAGSRCSYKGRTIDQTTQDYNFDSADFKAALLAEAKVLAFEHPNNDPRVLYGLDGLLLKESVPGWPKPPLGHLELRDVYVIDSTPLPVLGHYCFSHTVYYIDKSNWVPVLIEKYDADGKLWEETISGFMEIADNAQGGDYMIHHHTQILNFKDVHATVATLNAPAKVDDEVPAEYRDPAAAALPGSLVSVNK